MAERAEHEREVRQSPEALELAGFLADANEREAPRSRRSLHDAARTAWDAMGERSRERIRERVARENPSREGEARERLCIQFVEMELEKRSRADPAGDGQTEPKDSP
jgi:hypothetical protein